MTCPVCGATEVLEYRDTLDEGTVCEEARHCPLGCSEYEFHFGYHTERIGSQTWGWSWTETPTNYTARHQERQTAIIAARKARKR